MVQETLTQLADLCSGETQSEAIVIDLTDDDGVDANSAAIYKTSWILRSRKSGLPDLTCKRKDAVH